MVIHPFVFAIFPILFLYAYNIDQTPFKDAVIPLLISLAATAVLFLLLWLALKSAAKAGLIASAFVVLFFSYGPLLFLLRKTFLKVASGKVLFVVFSALAFIVLAVLVIRHKGDFKKLTKALNVVAVGLFIVVAVVLIALVLFHKVEPGKALFVALLALAFMVLAALIIRHKGDFKELTKALNVVAVVLIALSVINIAVHGTIASSGNKHAHKGVPVKKVAGLDRSKLPDVYYIILDAYVGEQTLGDYFNYDNSEFTGFLKEKGFYVASESRSNYPETFLSPTSSLNMEYINFLTEECGKNSKNRSVPYGMIEDNAVSRIFKVNGYEIVMLASNWGGTSRSRNADLVLAGNMPWGPGLEFTDALIRSTLLGAVVKVGGAARENVLYAFSKLPKIQSMIEGPRFVFAHILCPHPPYFFDRNGNPVKDPGESTTFGGRKDDYLDQLMYVNKRVEQLVSEILANSKNPPVIILQGDHGTAFLLGDDMSKMAKPSAEAVRERTGILNAYYLPPGGEGTPYETITPVNSFRLIFDRYFKTSYGQLDNRVYWSSYGKPYDFTDVTDTAFGGK